MTGGKKSWLCWLTSEAGRILKIGNKWCISNETHENARLTGLLYLLPFHFIPVHHIV